ncbi:hypothetical protein WJX82_005097 [Trebouxia sp. C0006]
MRSLERKAAGEGETAWFPSPIPIELPAVLTYSAEAAEEHYTEKAEAGRFARGCSHGNITPSVSFYSGSEAVCIYQSQTAPLLQGVLLCQAAFCQPDTEKRQPGRCKPVCTRVSDLAVDGDSRVPSQGAAAREEDDNVAESGKLRGGCLADVFTFSLTEVHGDKLSLLSQDDQLLSRPYRHSVKQECVT